MDDSELEIVTEIKEIILKSDFSASSKQWAS